MNFPGSLGLCLAGIRTRPSIHRSGVADEKKGELLNKYSFLFICFYCDKVCITYLTTGGSGSKESAGNAGDLGSIPGLGRSPGKGMATHCSILACEFHGQRSLAGYSPWSDRAGHD